MLKHSQILPAVVVLFQDIEWNDSEWSDKQLQCASLVQSLKNSLQVIRSTFIFFHTLNVLIFLGTTYSTGHRTNSKRYRSSAW
jgi:hypothetical protein